MPVKIRLRKTSLLDYPGRISSVFFFQGCTLRCPWCHNRELVLGESDERNNYVSLEEAFAHLVKRHSVLGGVVLSGGEPCLYEDLPGLIRKIKKLSLPVKLDTNGTLPLMLEKLFKQKETSPDYIAMDLKLAPERYAELGMRKEEGFLIAKVLTKSADMIRNSGIPHEFRSLKLPADYFTEKDIEALKPLAGLSPWNFRPFRGGNCLDPAWDDIISPIIHQETS